MKYLITIKDNQKTYNIVKDFVDRRELLKFLKPIRENVLSVTNLEKYKPENINVKKVLF